MLDGDVETEGAGTVQRIGFADQKVKLRHQGIFVRPLLFERQDDAFTFTAGDGDFRIGNLHRLAVVGFDGDAGDFHSE